MQEALDLWEAQQELDRLPKTKALPRPVSIAALNQKKPFGGC
jgi:hypothetical protein